MQPEIDPFVALAELDLKVRQSVDDLVTAVRDLKVKVEGLRDDASLLHGRNSDRP